MTLVFSNLKKKTIENIFKKSSKGEEWKRIEKSHQW